MKTSVAPWALVSIAIWLGAAPRTRPVEVDSLLAQLKSEDPERQDQAARRLARLILDRQVAHDDPQVLAGLKGLLLEGHGDASDSARWALCWMGMPALDAGVEAVRSKNPTAKGYGAQLLCHLARQFPDQRNRFDTAIDELAKYVRDENKFVRLCAIQALAEMGPKAVPPLIEALANPPGKGDLSAWNATEGLAKTGEEAVPALIQALADDDPIVRTNAAYALGRVGSESGRDALEKALEDENEKVREAARWALERLSARE